MNQTTTLIYDKVVDIVHAAVLAGIKAADATDDKGSNGSEAFQYVQLNAKGDRKLQNQLKKAAGVKHDAFYGYIITATEASQYGYGYWKGEAFCDTIAKYLDEKGIPAYAADRLL